MKYTKTQIKKAIKHWQKILESQTLLEWGAAKLEDLRNVPYQKSMDYDRWQAAQLMISTGREARKAWSMLDSWN